MTIGLVGSQLAVITWARKQPVTWAVIGLDLNAMLREVEKVTA